MTHWLSLSVKNIDPVFTWFRIDIKTSGSTADLCLHKGSFDALHRNSSAKGAFHFIFNAFL